MYFDRQIVCTLICLVICVGPHLGTVFSVMHTYAGLAMVAVIIAYAVHSAGHSIKPLAIAFILWIIAAVCIDIHLIDSSIQSGLIGKKMAQEAIKKTGEPVKSVYVINIEDDYPKLSSFCVIPFEAFGWGLAARYETNFQWPETIMDTTIERSADYYQKAVELGNKKIQQSVFDCVWMVDHDSIMIIKPSND